MTDGVCSGHQRGEESDEDEDAPAGAKTVSADEDFVEGRRLRRETLVPRYKRCIVKGLVFRRSVQGVSSCDRDYTRERAL